MLKYSAVDVMRHTFRDLELKFEDGTDEIATVQLGPLDDVVQSICQLGRPPRAANILQRLLNREIETPRFLIILQ